MKRIVLAVDTASDQPALVEAATQLAGDIGAEVAVLAVDDVESQRFAALPRETYLADAERAADAAVERLTAAGVRATAHVRSGRATDEILAFADEHDAEAILVGPGTRGRVARALLGDVTLRLVQRARRTVIVITGAG